MDILDMSLTDAWREFKTIKGQPAKKRHRPKKRYITIERVHLNTRRPQSVYASHDEMRKHPSATKLRRSRIAIDRMRLEQADLCPYCEKPLGKKYQIDHIIPITRGGTNAPENLCLAHPKCNGRKGNRLRSELPIDYFDHI